MDDATRATSERFGFGWTAGGRPQPITVPWEYHLHAMRTAVGAPKFQGLVLDAGCGEGIDLASTPLSDGCRIVGVELSHGGIEASSARIAGNPSARLVQGNLLAIPFRNDVFDAAYSYGVVHHTVDPERAVREIARTLKRGADLLIYVYENFDRRPLPWRIALAVVNAFRAPISRLPPYLIRLFCVGIAPFVYAGCTVPSRHFAFAARFPYPATQNPTMRSVVPDLYDRFAAPIEKRYSEQGARALVEQAGCSVKAVANLRGWVIWARKTSN